MKDRDRILITQLGEECAEVIQNISKVLRFGKDEIFHKQDLTNAERVTSEMNDLMGVFRILVNEGFLPPLDESKVIDKKRKVEHYMKYSLDLLK